MPLWIGRINEHKLVGPGRTDHSSVLRAVVKYIVLPMAAATADVKRVEIDLQFCLVTTAIYISSAGVISLGRWATGLKTTVWLIWNCSHNCEMTE